MSQPRERPLVLSALAILLTGVVLGLAFNQAALTSRSPRALPWLAVRRPLPSLEAAEPARARPSRGSEAGGEESSPASREPGPQARRQVVMVPPAHAETPTPARRAASGPAAPAPAGAGPERAAGGTESATPAPEAPAAPPENPAGVVALPAVPARDEPVEVGLETAKRFFDARGAVFVDAREPDDFAAGHIPGAVQLTSNDARLDAGRLERLDPDGRPIIAYCEGGACDASRELAEVLVESGFRRVLVFSAGWPAWRDAGYPAERGAR